MDRENFLPMGQPCQTVHQDNSCHDSRLVVPLLIGCLDQAADLRGKLDPFLSFPHFQGSEQYIGGIHIRLAAERLDDSRLVFIRRKSSRLAVSSRIMRRGDEASWTRSLVPPEPARSLQEHVGGGQLGDEQIGIKVHALLDNLGGNKDRCAPRCPALAKPFHPLVFEFLATPEGKPGMQKAKTESLACHGSKPLILLLRRTHRIANPEDATAVFGKRNRLPDRIVSRCKDDLNIPRRRRRCRNRRERLALPSSRDERIGKISSESSSSSERTIWLRLFPVSVAERTITVQPSPSRVEISLSMSVPV